MDAWITSGHDENRGRGRPPERLSGRTISGRKPRPRLPFRSTRSQNPGHHCAVPGRHAEGDCHLHRLDFQMVYVLKGWVRFWYEGHGEVLLKPGSCVHQPPGIVHREIEHSDDLELIEITLPADFETEPAEEAAEATVPVK